MITTPEQRIKLHEKRGLMPLIIHFVEVKSGLPAAVWRSLSVAERPGNDVFNEVIKPVIVNDAGTRVIVLTDRHYNALVDRVQELEEWLGEVVPEEEAAS